jgi:nitrate/nitrite-specific signal transduction histidine kinase
LSANGLNWLVVVVVPERDFMGQVLENLRNTAILGAIALVLSTILGYLLAGWIIRPVFTVTGVAASIEEEKWELAPLNTVSERTDELGQLARVFYKMAEELRAREQALRQQVRELSIQVDQVKREKQVKEITENDFFVDLQKRVTEMRARNKREGEA